MQDNRNINDNVNRTMPENIDRGEDRLKEKQREGNLVKTAENLGSKEASLGHNAPRSNGRPLPSKANSSSIPQSLTKAKDRPLNLPSNKNQEQTTIENNNIARQNLANLRLAGARELIKNYIQNHEMPGKSGQSDAVESASQGLLNGKKKKGLGQRIFDRATNGSSDKASDNKDESEKTIDEKSAEKEQKKIEQGEINFELSLKTIKWLVILTPILTAVLFFVLIVVASLDDEKTSSMVIAGMVAKEEGKKIISEVQSGQGDSLGQAGNEFPKEYYERLSSLGNIYSSQQTCSGQDCLTRSEFLYYLKIADISLRYKNKYHVDLDWYLISATNLYFAKSTEDTMKANLSNYNKNTVENYNTLSELDWDNDFKNLSGYQYLDADDSRYDLNILAKNMVTKTTIQTCTDRNGNVTKRQEDKDIEDVYFKQGAEKKLNCGNGATYNISSTYVKDTDKFDKFMLEYIDMKMYKAGSGKKNQNSSSSSSANSNSLASAFVNLALSEQQDPSAHGGQKYWSFMGYPSRVSWCAAFVSWVIENTSYNNEQLKNIIQMKSAAVVDFMNYFYGNNNSNIKFYYNDNCSNYRNKNGSGNYTPKQGDLIFFDWQGSWGGSMPVQYKGGPDHIGIVQKTEDNVIYTIEGNTTDSVAERSYDLNSCKVIGFGSWY